MTYQISTVSLMTKIPRNTLIAWERRYQIVEPSRHENGYRDYSEADVNILLRVRSAIDSGLKVSEAVRLVKGELQRDLEEEAEGSQEDFSEIITELTNALIHFRRTQAEELLLSLRGLAFETKMKQVFLPVLRRIGELWAQGEASVAQEHYASGVLRAHLAAFQLSLGQPGSHAPRAVCAAIAEEEHDIPALILAIRLTLSGYQVAYFGANTPALPLAQCIALHQPKLVCLSALSYVSPSQLDDYLAPITAALPAHSKIYLGGPGLPYCSELPESVSIQASIWDVPL